MKKIIIRTLSIVSVISLVGLVSIYVSISNRWSQYFSNQEMNELAVIVNTSTTFTGGFYKTYDVIHPGHRQRGMLDELNGLIEEFLFDDVNRIKTSPCRKVYRVISTESNIFENKTEWKDEYKGYIFGWGIENFATTEKCFDYIMSHRVAHERDSLLFNKLAKFGIILPDTIKQKDIGGPYKASILLFDKELIDLNQVELIELIIRFDNPSYYNSANGQGLLENKIREYERILSH